MPVVARFYGIVIKMYFSQSEHGIPHFHAIYGEYNAVFDIQTLEMLEGDLPVRAQRLVQEWGAQYQQELLRMWNTKEFKQLRGLGEECECSKN
ncbi:MAG: DUF4160 domain-containing protein [candidate division WOR-3 bacterium]